MDAVKFLKEYRRMCKEALEDMKGKYVRVASKGWGSSVKIIGNVISDKWFDYESFFEE